MATKAESSTQLTCKISILAILFYFSFTYADAQEKYYKLPDTLALDSSIRHGRLSNGFTYFIKTIPDPQSKLHLRLYNKAGSNQEDNDQFNVAHAIEHLAYKTTQNFPSGISNSNHIIKVGMEMGDYISAFSGPRVTEFHFNTPKDNLEALDVGLLFFKDIAIGLKLNEMDVKSVKGELWQEFLLGNGDNINEISANSEMYSEILSCYEDWDDYNKYNGNFSSKAVRRFYKDWYRPDLMAISIVGNIDDPVEMERLIKDTFLDIKLPKTPRKPIDCDSAYYKRPPQFVIVEQQSDTSKFLNDSTAKIHLIYRDTNVKDFHSTKSYRRQLKFKFLVNSVSKRIFQKFQKYKSSDVQVLDLSNSAGPRAMEVVLNVEKNGEKQILSETMEVLNQLLQYGVSELELQKYREEQIGFLESININEANYWIKEILKYYIEEEPLPPSKKEYTKHLWNNISLEEMNIFISDFLIKAPEDIGIIAPSLQNSLSWDEKEIRSFLEDELKKSVKPYKEPEKLITLMAPNEVESLKEKGYRNAGIGKSGAREIILNNGVKVVFKPYKTFGTTLPKIKIHGYSLRGANSFPEEHYFSALNAATIVRNSGVNGIDKFELKRFLESTSLRSGYVFPYVNSRESGIEGFAGVENIDTMLQLIYLYFTRPNKSKLAFEDWKNAEHKAYINPSYGLIFTDFENKIGEITGNSMGKLSTSGTKRFKGIGKTDFEMAYSLYHKIFENSSDFTFLISGDFEISKVLPLVQKYLGNLPEVGGVKIDYSIPLNIKPIPQESSFHYFPSQGNYKMKNISYGTRYIQYDSVPSGREKLKVYALGEILRQKLWDLRFKKGYAFYDLTAGGLYNESLKRFEIMASLECDPKEFEMLRKEVKLVFSELKSGSFSDKELKNALTRMYSIYDLNKASDPKIHSQKIYEHYRYGHPWVNPSEVAKFVKSISVKDVVEVANKYCTNENFYEFVMSDIKPEKLIK